MDNFNSTRLDCTHAGPQTLSGNCASFSGLRRSLNNPILSHMPPNTISRTLTFHNDVTDGRLSTKRMTPLHRIRSALHVTHMGHVTLACCSGPITEAHVIGASAWHQVIIHADEQAVAPAHVLVLVVHGQQPIGRFSYESRVGHQACERSVDLFGCALSPIRC